MGRATAWRQTIVGPDAPLWAAPAELATARKEVTWSRPGTLTFAIAGSSLHARQATSARAGDFSPRPGSARVSLGGSWAEWAGTHSPSPAAQQTIVAGQTAAPQQFVDAQQSAPSERPAALCVARPPR